MNHITLIIPFVPLSEGAINITEECILSYKEHVNKIILIRNGKYINADRLKNLVDEYIELDSNILMAGAINLGFLRAIKDSKTEFLCFANNDTTNGTVDFQELCKKGQMLSPDIGGQSASYGAHATFFVIHKDDFKRVGFWEVDRSSQADDYWFKRAIEAGIHLGRINTMVVNHPRPAFTNNDYSIIWQYHE